MTDVSGTPVECTKCGYETVAFGHGRLECPRCEPIVHEEAVYDPDGHLERVEVDREPRWLVRKREWDDE